MEEQGQTRNLLLPPPPPPPSTSSVPRPHDAGPSTSSPSTSSSSSGAGAQALESEVEVRVDEQQDNDQNQPHYNHHRRHHHRNRHYTRRNIQSSPLNDSVRFNISISDMTPTDMRDDVWSCLVVLVTFWFFAASMTLILGFYGSVNLQLGPNCSRLIEANPFFVKTIKAQEVDDQTDGPMLYGFHKSPSLDVESSWSETHSATIQSNFHKEWIYYLNPGSEVDITYNVTNPTYAPISLVIAQGRENLVEWIEDPSYPNTTLSWNIIYGSGRIQQHITASSTYFVAVGNLNAETAEVSLNFTIKARTYDTSEAYYKCSLSNRVCSFDLFLFKANAAVLTSPSPGQVKDDDDWYVKVSYGPRWVTYFVGSAVLTIAILLLFRACNLLRSSQGDEGTGRHLVREPGVDQEPLLSSPKDDDLSSWGSSYDSLSNDEEDLEDQIPQGVSLVEGKQDGEEVNNDFSNNPRRLCVICFGSPRDCFFLPCGHCAACFTCGSRVAEEAGTCPICRRQMKKVRKIFSV